MSIDKYLEKKEKLYIPCFVNFIMLINVGEIVVIHDNSLKLLINYWKLMFILSAKKRA